MQLSLPNPVSPTTTVPNAGSVSGPLTSPSTPTVSAGEPFDSFLSQGAPDDKSKADPTSPEAENGAAVLAALLWMPMAPITPPVAVDLSLSANGQPAVGRTTDTMPANGIAPGVLAAGLQPTSLRSFAAVRSQVANSGFPPTAVSEIATVSTERSGIMEKTAMPQQNGAQVSSTDTAVTNSRLLPTCISPAPLATSPAAIKSVDGTDKKLPGDGVTELSPVAQSDTSAENQATPLLNTIISPGMMPVAKSDPNQEKIAALPPMPPAPTEIPPAAREKYFLEPVQKAVTAVATGIGIAVAKLNASMSATAPVRQKSSSPVDPTSSFVFSAEAAPSATLTADAPAPVATIRETLAAVISAVETLERRAEVQQKSVDLQFHVGSEKLGLHVELRDGTVHTTFRTESPEMASTLSREWHSVVQPALAREIRLAEPVFNSVARDGNGASFNLAGQGSSQQREQQKAPSTFVPSLNSEFYDSAVADAAPAVSPASNSSQLLNALA